MVVVNLRGQQPHSHRPSLLQTGLLEGVLVGDHADGGASGTHGGACDQGLASQRAGLGQHTMARSIAGANAVPLQHGGLHGVDCGCGAMGSRFDAVLVRYEPACTRADYAILQWLLMVE